MKSKLKERKGITLIALVVTIVVLLILAGVTISTLTGDNGIITRANRASVAQIEGQVDEEVKLAVLSAKMYSEKMATKNAGWYASENLESVVNEMKKDLKEQNGYTITKEDETGTITVQYQTKKYQQATNNSNAKIIMAIILSGNTFTIHNGEIEKVKIEETLYQTNGNVLVEGTKYTEIMLTIKISNQEEFDSIEEIKLARADGKEIEENATVIGEGNKSYKITGDGTYTITVKTIKGEIKNTATKQIVISEKIDKEEFSRAYGEIDIKFLSGKGDTISNIANKPVLGSMTPVNFDASTNSWKETTEENWKYSYNNEAGTSEWANAVVKDANGNITGYFVWIPRYAYKIAYYKEESHTNIVGYSDSRGIVHEDGNEIISATNRRKVGDNYIVHPSFIKDTTVGGWNNELKGIWVAKYEASGNTSTGLKVLPATQSWRTIKVGDTYTQAENYNTRLNSHLMKNSEWGAVAYLTYSNYGLGWETEIEVNKNSSYYTGGATTEKEVYTTNVGQSTTGNAYGIYDMSGGAWEYMASYVNNGSTYIDKTASSFATSDKASAISNEKVTVYKASNSETDSTSDNQSTNYQISGEMMYGDAVYETSMKYSGNPGGWQNDGTNMPFQNCPFFFRSGIHEYDSKAGIFYFSYTTPGVSEQNTFRPVLVPEI